ncbi:MAG: aromatic acid/H+ symport family MFS transporter [Pseudomonadales bacterium]|jgi:AAHS family 4-hydroxybenzoate transporter-like MFS transporter|nr:aromatic acid/H+ symport family MFS transporter [Pseudomonadales bacterium]
MTTPDDLLDQWRLSPLQWRVIILCSLVVLLDGFDTQVIGYLGPALSKEWEIPSEQLGPVFSASLVGLMVGLLCVGVLADYYGRRFCILCCVALFAVFTLLTAFAQGVTDLMLWRFLAGIGLGGAMPNALALTGEYCPRRLRATLTILMFCGFSLGSIIGGLLTAVLDSVGWRPVFLTGAVLPLLLLPFLMRLLPESLQFLLERKQDERGVHAQLARINPLHDATTPLLWRRAEGRLPVTALFHEERRQGTLLLWLVFFCNLMVFYFLQNWLPTLFTDAGLARQDAVLMSTLISWGGIVAGLLSGPLMDRYNPCLVLAGLYLGGTVFVALMGLASAASLAAATFCAGFCVSGAQKSINGFAVLFYPVRMRSTGVGWALGIGRFGSILGPVAAGYLLSWGWSYASLMQVAALPMLVAALAIYLVGRRYYGAGRHSA